MASMQATNTSRKNDRYQGFPEARLRTPIVLEESRIEKIALGKLVETGFCGYVQCAYLSLIRDEINSNFSEANNT